MDAIEIRLGTAVGVLTPSTPDDFAYINANLRDMDKVEHDVFDKINNGEDTKKLLDKAWTVRIGGEIVSYFGFETMPMQSVMSRIRYMASMSTKNADKHRVDFARLSKPGFNFMLSQLDPFVNELMTLALARYEDAMRWLVKGLGWRICREITIGGEKFYDMRFIKGGK